MGPSALEQSFEIAKHHPVRTLDEKIQMIVSALAVSLERPRHWDKLRTLLFPLLIFLVAAGIDSLAQAMTETRRQLFIQDMIASLICAVNAVLPPQTLIGGAHRVNIRLHILIDPTFDGLADIGFCGG